MRACALPTFLFTLRESYILIHNKIWPERERRKEKTLRNVVFLFLSFFDSAPVREKTIEQRPFFQYFFTTKGDCEGGRFTFGLGRISSFPVNSADPIASFFLLFDFFTF